MAKSLPNGLKRGDQVYVETWVGYTLVTALHGELEHVTYAGRASVVCDGRWVGSFSPENVGASKFEHEPLERVAERMGLVMVSPNRAVHPSRVNSQR